MIGGMLTADHVLDRERPGLLARRCGDGHADGPDGDGGEAGPSESGKGDGQVSCRHFYDCQGCGALLRPKPGDCCVFCSYGTVLCPPIQIESKGGLLRLTHIAGGTTGRDA